MKSIIEFISEITVRDWCNIGILICFSVLFVMMLTDSDKKEREFTKWLSENSTKTKEGHYFYTHDKSGRLYSRKELRDFFNQKETKFK